MNGIQGIGLGFLIGGGCFALYAVRACVRRWALLSNAVRTRGKVIRLRRQNGSDDSSTTFTYALVRYKAEGGLTLEQELPPTQDEDEFKVGAKVALLYERGNPTNVTDTGCRWQDVLTWLVMSTILLGLGALMFFGSVDSREQPPHFTPDSHAPHTSVVSEDP
jgi:hypothetical protein